ncbi:MAG: hypothetical protein ACON4N_12275, partial [Myxococcota bacterium]
MPRRLLWLALLVPFTAQAVPEQLTHQGQLLDANGLPIEDTVDMTFRVMTSDTGGTALWSEVLTVDVEQGFYTVTLGADVAGNPLDDATLEQWPLFLEVQLAGQAPMTPRLELSSVPFARSAGTADVATSIDGGDINAASVSIGGAPVIDTAGNWVGNPIDVSWNDLNDVPSELLSTVDNDTLAALTCNDGDFAMYDTDNAAWMCGQSVDTTRTDAEIVSAVEASPVDLAFGASAGGYTLLVEGDVIDWSWLTNVPADLVDGDDDTLATLACTTGQTVLWNGTAWTCSTPSDTGTVTDTTLTETEVDAFVANNGYALQSEVFSGSYTDLTNVPADQNTQLTEAEVDAFVANNGFATTSQLFSGSYTDLTNVPVDQNTQLSEAEVDAFVANNGFATTSQLFSGSYTDLTNVPADQNTQLSEAEVDAFVANNGYALQSDLFSGNYADLVGAPEATDTLADLNCVSGQVATWNGTAWACATPSTTGTGTDTTLSEAEVDAFVANNGYALQSDLFSGNYADLTGVPTDQNTQLSEAEVDAFV